jgi:ABC-type sugar transport system ATPase subunit
MATIRLAGISKRFHGYERIAGLPLAGPTAAGDASVETRALDAIDLTIYDGETLAIVGPSGCGKSTLLRVIAGLTAPDEGRVFFDDEDATDRQPADRGIGFVFQSFALYPHMKGEGNLSFFFRLRHRPRPEIEEKVRVTAEILGVGFDTLLDRKPGTLSGGQRQRVALGRCIVRDPRIMLLDEPLSSLDAELRQRTRAELKRLIRRFAVTTAYVTHDQVEALALGDRIAVMRSGRFEQVGGVEDVYHKPRNAFVAGFVGSPPMNLLEARCDEDGAHVLVGPLRLDLSATASARTAPGAPLLVGIRPEDIGIGPGSGPTLEARVEVVEPMAGLRGQLATLRAGSLALQVLARNSAPFAAGDSAWLTFPPEKCHVFDARTEQALE